MPAWATGKTQDLSKIVEENALHAGDMTLVFLKKRLKIK
jgi:hypothetical protein